MSTKKRFKPGSEPLDLAGGTFRIDEDGEMEIRISGSGWFTPEQFQRIVEAFPIETVTLRTPGEVYFDTVVNFLPPQQ